MVATLNPADKKGDLVVLSNGDLTASGTDAANNWVRSTTAKTGKRYVEFTMNTVANSIPGISDLSAITYPGSNANSFGIFSNGFGSIAGTFPNWATPFASGNVVGMAVDFTAQLIWWRVGSGNWNGSGTANPATGTGGFSIAAYTGTPHYIVLSGDLGCVTTVNFGSTAFANTAPSGFDPWETSTYVIATGQEATAAVGTVTVTITGGATVSGQGMTLSSGPFTDNFNRTNANLEASSNWSHDGLITGALAITSSTVLRCTTTNATGSAYKSPDTGTAEHYVQCRYQNTGGGGPFVCCRLTDVNTFLGMRNIATTGLEVFRRVSGSFTSLYASGSGLGLATSDLIRLEASGSNWALYRNGTLLSSGAIGGAGVTSTRQGLVARSVANNPWIDDYEAGNLRVTITVGSGVFVNVTGQAATVSVGTIANVIGKANAQPTTNVATVSVGDVTVNFGASATAAGQQIAASVGDVTTEFDYSVEVTPRTAYVSVGDVTVDAVISFDVDVDVTGQQLTASVGTVIVSLPTSFSLSGQFMVMSAGTVTVGQGVGASVTGQQVAASSGDASVIAKVNVIPTGQALISAVGTPTVISNSNITVTTNLATASVGTIATVRQGVGVTAAGQQVVMSAGQASADYNLQVTIPGAVPQMTMQMGAVFVSITGGPVVNKWDREGMMLVMSRWMGN